MTTISIDRRRELCQAQGITLDGEPARISGALHQFALVRRLDNGLGCEWAWETVDRIAATTGRFYS